MKQNFNYPLIAFIVLFIGFTIWFFKSIVAYILISAVIALIGRPLVAILSKVKIWKYKLPRALTAAITLVAIWLIIFGFFRLFIPLLANQANEISSINVQDVIKNFSGPIHNAENYITKWGIVSVDDASIQNYITNKAISIINIANVSNFMGTLINILGNIFVAFFAISFISFFFLKNESMFQDGVVLLVPTKFEKHVRTAINSIEKLLMRYFGGITIDVICIITLNTVGMMIVGVQFQQAMVIGLITGILNIIPYVGPIIGMMFGISIGMITNANACVNAHLVTSLGSMLLVFVIVQIIDATFIQPTIFSNSVKAHPLEIFLVIMMAGTIAGVLGMILAIPSYTILRVIAKEFFITSKVVRKITENL